jgi:xanthosine utilization system XapX-like protein
MNPDQPHPIEREGDMAISNNYFVAHVVVPSALVFVLIIGVVGILLGLGLIARNQSVLRLLDRLNQWTSIRRALKPLEVPRDIEQGVRKHPRALGVAVLVGAAFSLYFLLLRVSAPDMIAMLATGTSKAALLLWFANLLRWALIAANLIALAIGVVLTFAPQAMGPLAASANRWISSRQLAMKADEMDITIDLVVRAHPRLAGALIAVGALVPAIGATMMLFGGR